VRSVRFRRNPSTTWAGRLLRGRRPDRNPLRRGSDRAETAVFGVLLAAFIAAAPFTAYSAGSWSHAISAHQEHVQQTSSQQVTAVLLEAPINWGSYTYGSAPGPEADASWQAPNGQVQTGLVPVPASARAGSKVLVTINRAGQLSVPLSSSEVAERASLAEGLAVAVLAIVLIVAGRLTRWALDRRRLAGWDADWLATEPRWRIQR
jgi:hypothetical protein